MYIKLRYAENIPWNAISYIEKNEKNSWENAEWGAHDPDPDHDNGSWQNRVIGIKVCWLIQCWMYM